MILTPRGRREAARLLGRQIQQRRESYGAAIVNGKPAYLEGKPIDGRVDLFALGTVMMHGVTAADMARGLDDFVVGSQQRLDKVAAFVPEIEAISPLTQRHLWRAQHARIARLRRRRGREELTVEDHSSVLQIRDCDCHLSLRPWPQRSTFTGRARPRHAGRLTERYRNRVGADHRSIARRSVAVRSRI